MISDDDIRAVLDAHQDRLLALPHVVAAGIVDADDPAAGRAVAIYVDTLDAHAKLPAELEAVVHGTTVRVPTAVKLMGTLSF